MVRCADGTLYTGYARDPGARVGVHNSGKGAKYTRSRLPVALVYSEQCESLSAALKRERQVKPWSRAKKEALIAGIGAITRPAVAADPPPTETG
jgi:predicted GIY-YIG superfamily endonuclease